ncbi:MAG: hypothetical protein JW918_16570 [Anaerolineae bacterium]|nr:hypothetical protein [Anaerolineae bacterium]
MRVRLLLAGGLSLLATLLVIVFRDAVHEIVVEPLWNIVVVVHLLLGYLPQGLFWTLFILAALYLAAKSLAGQGRPSRSRPTEVQYPGQVGAWARRIHLVARGDYSRWYFLQYLGKLTVSVLADRERLDPREIRRRLKARELDVPPEVQACIQAEMAVSVPRRLPDVILRLWQRVKTRPQRDSSDSDLETIVQFLEHQLEVSSQ